MSKKWWLKHFKKYLNFPAKITQFCFWREMIQIRSLSVLPKISKYQKRKKIVKVCLHSCYTYILQFHIFFLRKNTSWSWFSFLGTIFAFKRRQRNFLAGFGFTASLNCENTKTSEKSVNISEFKSLLMFTQFSNFSIFIFAKQNYCIA